MERFIVFGVLSIAVIIISRRNLINPKTHGFYRLISWICMCWLFANNYKFWFTDPFSPQQIISWILLLISLYLVLAGIIRFVISGKPSQSRVDDSLFGFEKTTGLIDKGLYRLIRHPLYASLIFLSWGIFFKQPGTWNFVFAMASTIFLYITSRFDEIECIAYFGEEYREYMKRSKMFIPFIF
jgi:protein-S-isoprenylcysteine O-methyltransferase Ste14